VLEWLFKAQSHYRRLLRENNYDLVHAFFGFPTAWLCFRSADKLPYIISLRGSDVPGKHARLKLDYKILAPVFKAIWKKASALIACSQGLKDRALQFMPSAAIDVITNGIDLNMFQPAQNNKAQQELKLLTVGRLSVTKRFEILIDAVEILHKAGRNLHLTIAGGGAMLDGLKQIVSQKNLTDIIDVKGRIESDLMPDLYRQNDIFISASMQEGMSNAMLEAMASGLPIITTRCEGVDELIADNGIVVEQARPDAIADEIQKLADDKNGYELMCKAARKKAEQFGWDNTAEQYLRYYKNIANQYS
jgi:glycosyltransferase involved in cell wall biosynthesis